MKCFFNLIYTLIKIPYYWSLISIFISLFILNMYHNRFHFYFGYYKGVKKEKGNCINSFFLKCRLWLCISLPVKSSSHEVGIGNRANIPPRLPILIDCLPWNWYSAVVVVVTGFVVIDIIPDKNPLVISGMFILGTGLQVCFFSWILYVWLLMLYIIQWQRM